MAHCLRCPRQLGLAALLLAAGWPHGARAEDPTLAERVRQLEAQVQTLSSKSGELLRTRNFRLRMSGFVQADAVAYSQASEDQLDGSTGQPLNETRFLIRRARIRVEADATYAGSAVELDGSTVQGAQVRLIGAEAWVQWPAANGRPPYLQATAGLFKIPFGREVLQYDPDRLFMERSQVVRALFPGEYDLGVRVQGGWRFVRYALAGMNGEPSGEQAFAARDPNQSKDLVGRLGVDTAIGAASHLRCGVSGVYGTGFSPGRPPSKDVLGWRDDNDDGQVQLSELEIIRGRAATPSQNFSRDAIGLDAELTVTVPRLGELQLSGEFIWARNLDRGLVPADPIAIGRDLRELGYYVGVTQAITPYLRLGLRYDSYDPDADRQEQRGVQRVPSSTSFATLAVVAAVQHPRYGRFTFEYDNNRNALGRSAAGTQITLGRDMFVLRAQVVF